MQALWWRLPKITQGAGRPACEVYVPISCQLSPSPPPPSVSGGGSGAWSPFRWVCSMGRDEGCAMRETGCVQPGAASAAQTTRCGMQRAQRRGRLTRCSLRKARCARHPCAARSWTSVTSPAATSAVTCGAEIQTVVSVPTPCPAPPQGLRLDKNP